MTTWWNKMIGSVASGNNSAGIVDYDGSDEYTKRKKVAFYLYHSNTRNVVTFKPFLSSISYKIQYEDGEEIIKNIDGRLKRDTPKAKISYAITLDVPSQSLKEAKYNLAKANELKSFQFSTIAPGVSPNYSSLIANTKFIYLTNLIQNGKTTKGKNLKSWKDMVKNGLPCLIDSVKVDIKKDLGFFEENGMLYPKYFTINFDAEVLIEQVFRMSKKRLYTPYKESGAYYKNDSKYWPFGVKGYKSTSAIKKYDGSQTYANNKGAWFSLCNRDVAGTYAILPFFMESLSFDYMNKEGNTKPWRSENFFSKVPVGKPANELKVSLSFNAPAHSLEDAKYTMYTIQKLIRLINLKKGDYLVPNTDVSSFTTGDSQKEFEKTWKTKNGSTNPKYDEDLAKAIGEYRYPKSHAKAGKRVFIFHDLKPSVQAEVLKKMKNFYSEKIPNEDSAEWNTTYSSVTRSNVIHVTSLLGKNKISGKPSYGKIIASGHNLHVISFSFEPDLSLGFFEEDGMLYYKLIKFSFELEAVAERGLGLVNPSIPPAIDDPDDKAFGSSVISGAKYKEAKQVISKQNEIKQQIDQIEAELENLDNQEIFIKPGETFVSEERYKWFEENYGAENVIGGLVTTETLEERREDYITDLERDKLMSENEYYNATLELDPLAKEAYNRLTGTQAEGDSLSASQGYQKIIKLNK